VGLDKTFGTSSLNCMLIANSIVIIK